VDRKVPLEDHVVGKYFGQIDLGGNGCGRQQGREEQGSPVQGKLPGNLSLGTFSHSGMREKFSGMRKLSEDTKVRQLQAVWFEPQSGLRTRAGAIRDISFSGGFSSL
jgi:hypothetical protein